MTPDEVESWDEYETGNEHYRCSACRDIGPIPRTSEERQRQRAEHLAERHRDGRISPGEGTGAGGSMDA